MLKPSIALQNRLMTKALYRVRQQEEPSRRSSLMLHLAERISRIWIRLVLRHPERYHRSNER